MPGRAAHARARRLAEWYETDAALVVLGEARLAAAMVDGLLSRTYFRNSADAVRRTGLAGADIDELGARLPRRPRSWPPAAAGRRHGRRPARPLSTGTGAGGPTDRPR